MGKSRKFLFNRKNKHKVAVNQESKKEYEKIDEESRSKPLEIQFDSVGPDAQKVIDLLKELRDLRKANQELEEGYDKFRRKILTSLLEWFDSLNQLIGQANLRTYENFLQHLESEKNNLDSMLRSYGISPMQIIINKTEFSPDCHEPIREVKRDNNLPDGTIVRVIKPGYYLDDEVLCFAKVQISKRID